VNVCGAPRVDRRGPNIKVHGKRSTGAAFTSFRLYFQLYSLSLHPALPDIPAFNPVIGLQLILAGPSILDMASLSLLPNEVLNLIFHHLATTVQLQSTLANLCRVSRRFRPVVQKRLYASPQCHWLTYEDIWIFTTLLVRTLLRNTELRLKVRHLSLHVPYYIGDLDASPGLENEVHRLTQGGADIWRLLKGNLGAWTGLLLLLVRDLETLELSGTASRHSLHWIAPRGVVIKFFDSPMVNFEKENALQSLHTLKLCAFSLSKSWATLPRLQHLELDGQYKIHGLPNISNIDITSLTVHYDYELFYDDQGYWLRNTSFLCLLRKCNKLKHLRLYFLQNLDGPNILWAVKYPNFDVLCEQLTPVADTLESLDLTTSPRSIAIDQLWLSNSRPVLSLARFRKLRDLTIYAEALYQEGTDGSAPATTILPSSIENLRVRRPTAPVMKTLCDAIKQDAVLSNQLDWFTISKRLDVRPVETLIWVSSLERLEKQGGYLHRLDGSLFEE
jgi:hypothetical protein